MTDSKFHVVIFMEILCIVISCVLAGSLVFEIKAQCKLLSGAMELS